MVDFEWLQKLTDPGWIFAAKGHHYSPEEFQKDVRNIEDLAQGSDSYFGYSCYDPQAGKEEYQSGLIKELQREKRNLEARNIPEDDSEFKSFEEKIEECYVILTNIVKFCNLLDRLDKHKPVFGKYRQDIEKLSKNLPPRKYRKRKTTLFLRGNPLGGPYRKP